MKYRFCTDRSVGATGALRQRGFTLVEAMVGLVIFSVGLLSLASLQSELLSSTGESKARTEAAQIAEAELERMRSYADRAGFDDIGSLDGTTASVNGTNATFTVTRGVDAVNADLWSADIVVDWEAARSGDQSLSLQTLIAWDSSVAGGRAAGGGLGPDLSSSISEGAETRDRGTGTPTAYIDLPGSVTAWDGTSIYESDDGRIELLDYNTGEVLLVSETGDPFSTISGAFFVDADALNANQFDPADIVIGAYGITVCRTVTNGGGLWAFPQGTPNPDYEYFGYRCYVGPGWFGNVYTNSLEQNTNQRNVCVGQPGVVDNGLWDSPHPQESPVREYRGFKDVAGSPEPAITGIGIDADGIYTAQELTEHHFLYTSLGNNETCDQRLDLTDPSPFAADPGELYDDADPPYLRKPGYGFCFTPGHDLCMSP